SPEFLAGFEALQRRRAAAWAARAAGLPAVDPRVPQSSSAPPVSAAVVRPMAKAGAGAGPGSQIEGAAFLWRATEIVPPTGYGSVVNEPTVSQNGKYVHETWNWFAARSSNGGAGFALINPFTYPPAMSDFCCDQDTIYAKGRDRFFWERLGYLDVDPTANNENRIVINVSQDAFATTPCYTDLRGSNFGEANALLDYPRLSL